MWLVFPNLWLNITMQQRTNQKIPCMLVSVYNTWYTILLFFLEMFPWNGIPNLMNEMFFSSGRVGMGMQPLWIEHIHPPSKHWINTVLITEFPFQTQRVRKGNTLETLEKMKSWAMINPRLFSLLRSPIRACNLGPCLQHWHSFPKQFTQVRKWLNMFMY